MLTGVPKRFKSSKNWRSWTSERQSP